MKVPPFLLGSALLFWGWCLNQLPIAVLLALSLELSRLSRWQWQIEDQEFFRVADLCAVLLLGTVVYVYNSYPLADLLFVLLQWLPLLLFPLIGVQVYSERQNIPLSALVMRLRRQEKRTGKKARRFDFSYPFLAHCLLAASVVGNSIAGFYIGLAILCAWALWPNRSLRYPNWLWASCMVVAIGLGYLNQLGILRLQQKTQALLMGWYKEFFLNQSNPYHSHTALGYIGTLKLSNDILLRVAAPSLKPPPLLRGASYNMYHQESWYAKSAPLRPVFSLPDKKTWAFHSESKTGTTLRISDYTNRKGQGVLKLPQGTYHIENLPVAKLRKNNLDTFKIERGPGFLEYTLQYNAKLPSQQSYNSLWDLDVPEQDVPVLDQVLATLDLTPQTNPNHTLETLYRFFQDQFRYTIVVKGTKMGTSPVANFLLHSRAGHCEYFATSTVLLLRRLGIPARYATGYSVQELSPWNQNYLVRQRHAHAWALVYINGIWQDFDTTSANWNELEEEAYASLWQSLNDFGTWLHYHFSRWRWSEADDSNQRWLVWALVPLTLLLLWRLYQQRRVQRPDRPIVLEENASAYCGQDSPFFAVLAQLNKAGIAPLPGETLLLWLQRLDTPTSPWQIKTLYPLLQRHYRYRFHPKGLTDKERNLLDTEVKQWLAQM